MQKILLFVSCLASVGIAEARMDLWSGGLWPDDNGVHINAHGGGVMWHEGRYYWYGEHKGPGKAGNVAHGTAVHCYSSADLRRWKDEGAVLTTEKGEGHDLEEGCVIERPKVVYCPKTGKFVMYFHLELKTDSDNPGYRYGSARVGIAVNDTPTGEFTYLKSRRPNAGVWPQGLDTNALTFAATADARAIANWRNGGVNETVKNCKYVFAGTFDRGQTSRDQTLFVDDDGKAYHVYTSEHNSTLHISELADDFIHETGRYWRLAKKDWTEAPAICKHNGWYYILGSGCTGWAPNAARYYRSWSIAGPWERMDNPCRGTDEATGLGADLTWGGQSTCIFPVHGKPDSFVAMFDRWCPTNAIDGRYVWREIVFSNDGSITIPWRKDDSVESLTGRIQHGGNE